MKPISRLIILIVLVLSLGYFSWRYFSHQSPVTQPETQVLGAPTKTPSHQLDVLFQGTTFKASWFQADPAELSLHSNLEEKLVSQQALEKFNCRFLTSAAFYTKEGHHLGYFLTQDQLLSPQSKSELFNGLLSVNRLLTPRITKTIPQDPLLFAIQSGPLLIENSFFQDLTINNDKPARRIVAAVSGTNDLYFIVFYDPNSVFSGPYLADLPSVLDLFQQKANLSFADAINLDGGTASAFYSPDLELSELAPIGSFFCLQ